jgi:hypothetical protein
VTVAIELDPILTWRPRSIDARIGGPYAQDRELAFVPSGARTGGGGRGDATCGARPGTRPSEWERGAAGTLAG